jgi:sugar O-acyltransferase (sialic acid O-acetyltransferase NeuD family)
MDSVIIFGTGQIAEIAHFYFTHDSRYSVTAFTVDGAYMKEGTFCGLTVVPFEEVEQAYTPATSRMFVAVSYTKINKVRTEKYLQAKSKGYTCVTYVSSKATTWPGSRVGENCFILEDNTIQPFVRIGDNVTLWSGNHIGHHSVIGDNCFIASHVVVSGGVQIGDNSFVGVNATIRDHIKIGKECVIGAGALVLSDTKEREVYFARGSELSKVPSNRLRHL